MPRLCLDCYRIFSDEMRVPASYYRPPQCPLLECSGELIGVDENMLPVVITLNKKGYQTHGSCSTHLWSDEGYVQAYVKFKPEHCPGDDLFDTCETIPLPSGFELVHAPDGNVIRSHRCGGSRLPRKLKYSERQMLVFNYLQTLLRWAEDLPKRKKGSEKQCT